MSAKYGSLSWQYRYDSRQENNRAKKMFLSGKAALIVIIVGLFTFIWFLAGLVTFGVLWPKSIRRFIFGQAALADTTEIEELRNDVLAVADNVKWIRNDKENERHFNSFGGDIKSKRSKENIEVKMEPSTKPNSGSSVSTFQADDGSWEHTLYTPC